MKIKINTNVGKALREKFALSGSLLHKASFTLDDHPAEEWNPEKYGAYR